MSDKWEVDSHPTGVSVHLESFIFDEDNPPKWTPDFYLDEQLTTKDHAARLAKLLNERDRYRDFVEHISSLKHAANCKSCPDALCVMAHNAEALLNE